MVIFSYAVAREILQQSPKADVPSFQRPPLLGQIITGGQGMFILQKPLLFVAEQIFEQSRR